MNIFNEHLHKLWDRASRKLNVLTHVSSFTSIEKRIINNQL